MITGEDALGGSAATRSVVDALNEVVNEESPSAEYAAERGQLGDVNGEAVVVDDVDSARANT